jgi:deoxyribonuclease V
MAGHVPRRSGLCRAVVTERRRLLVGVTSSGPAGRPYLPTLLGLREGPLLEQAVRALPVVPEVLLVNASGRDHARRAGLALHLGAVLGLPTVGVTTRPLVAQGAWPSDVRGATAPLWVGGELVGCWVRTRMGAKPVAVHAAWRTDAQAAVQVVLAATRRARTLSHYAAPALWLEPAGRTSAERQGQLIWTTAACWVVGEGGCCRNPRF